MRRDQLEDKPIAEREYQLWTASEQCLSGKINVDKFEDEEYRHEQNFREIGLTHQDPNEDKLLRYLLIATALVLILVGLAVFASTKNQFTLLVPSIALGYLIRVLLDRRPIKQRQLGRGR